MATQNNSYINIRDIAKLAGVSIATVSRVINHPELTTPKTRERVLSVIEKHHYVPNQTMKSIFSRSSNSIALFVYDMTNPFFISLIQELNRVAFQNKYALLICDTANDAKKEQDYLNYCVSVQVKGIILTEGFDFVATSEFLRSPLVMFDRSGLNTWSAVQSDNVDAIYRAVHYLYNFNHRRIAFVMPDVGLLSIARRLQGFSKATEELGIAWPEYVFSQGDALDVEVGKKALNYFLTLAVPPTAIICANDMLAQGILVRAQELHIKVPEDLSVIGFDGVSSPLFAKPLTTIRQDIPTIAQTLIDLCLHPREDVQSIIIPTEFISGNTCCYYRKK